MKYPDLYLKGTERVAPKVESQACVPGPDSEVRQQHLVGAPLTAGTD